MLLAPELIDRFDHDLDPLAARGARLGVAVSGGPDSLALLLLAAAARPGQVEAATVDHALRPESRDEARLVAEICAKLDVPHAILTAQWTEVPTTALQERTRQERYRLLGGWAAERGLGAIVTAHHLDDQAETLLMRLARGSGVRGLAGMRGVTTVPGGTLPLMRPLLGWRRTELAEICNAAGLSPVIDPSNADSRFERVRLRGALAAADWLDPAAIAASAAHLASAEAALEWAVDRAWQSAVTVGKGEILFHPGDAPREIRRRLVGRILAALASEGDGATLRGPELDRLLGELESGCQSTLRGVLASGGERWRFVPAPQRTRRGNHSR